MSHFFISLLVPILAINSINKEGDCESRCQRLHERSIQRVGLDAEKITHILEKQRPLSTAKDVCWRLYDRLDCLKKCPKNKEHDKYARDVRFKCRSILSSLADILKCVSKHRSFMQIKCSTFLKEAVSKRIEQDPNNLPDRETCRYLHLNSLCLENTVGTYCPTATKVFRRLNFRDYFSDFIIPEDDRLFDDDDLDSCQIYDFVKTAKSSEEDLVEELTTMINKWEDEERRTMPMKTTTMPSVSSMEKKEFTAILEELLSSTETLADTTTVETTIETSLQRIVPSLDDEEEPHISTVDNILVETSSHGTTVDLDKSSTIRTTDQMTRSNPSYTKKTILKESLPSPSISTSSPIQTRTVSYEYDDGTTIVIPSNVRNVFSDDSLEETPPQFYWSSGRYRTSTLSANNGRHYSSYEREIVEPVEVDTTTLLGEDFPLGSVETEIPSWRTTPSIKFRDVTSVTVKPMEVSTTSATTRKSVSFSPRAEMGTIIKRPMATLGPIPLLNGGVFVKSIKKWGEPESEEEVTDKMQKNPTIDEEDLNRLMGKEDDYVYEDVTQKTSSLSDKEILLLIYLILFGMAVISLLAILLFCICCRRSLNKH